MLFGLTKAEHLMLFYFATLSLKSIRRTGYQESVSINLPGYLYVYLLILLHAEENLRQQNIFLAVACCCY